MGGVVFNGNWLFSLAQPRGEITNLWKAALEHAWHSENGLQGSREGCDGEALIRSDILNKVALVK